MTIKELIRIDDTSYRVFWHDREFEPPRQQVTQASGICFTEHSEIVLVRGTKKEWMLPGGHPIGAETLEAACIREVS